jgi:indolepyruvate decarboxylase
VIARQPSHGEPSQPVQLFAYGTLVPRDPDRLASEGWESDAVRGRLFDLGPYPALVDLDDPTADWVEGFVRPVEEAELRDRLDPYEGVDEGPYRRERVTTQSGRLAWIYIYARPLPLGARGPLVRWEGPRAGLAAEGRSGDDRCP